MEYDVFLSYRHADEAQARKVIKALRGRGVRVWDDSMLRPGTPWQEGIEAVISTVPSAVILIGRSGLGPWETQEMRALINELVERGLRLIPVFLEGAPASTPLPPFLRVVPEIDLRGGVSDRALDRLVWGLLDRRPESLEALVERGAERPWGSGRAWRALLDRVAADAADFLGDVDAPRLAVPRHRVRRVGDPTGTPIPADADLLGLHREGGGELLLLGAPGAGKTTVLYELARAAVERALGDPWQPLPVVLELSRWRGGDGGFGGWIVERVAARYRIRKERVAVWQRNRELLLLLDGFDQVERRHRPECLRAIARLCRELGPLALVVASRTTELQAALATGVELDFAEKIALQPLSDAQVRSFLDAGGPALAAVRRAFERDPRVAELARSPLWLGLMRQVPAALDTAVIEDAAIEDAATGPGASAAVERLRGRVLDACIDRRLDGWAAGGERRRRESGERRLRWLARSMVDRGLDDLYLEDLQPSWLDSIGARWRYALATRGAAGLLLGAAASAASGGDAGLLLFGLAAGVGVGAIDGGRLEWAARTAAGAGASGRNPARIGLYVVTVVSVLALSSAVAALPGEGGLRAEPIGSLAVLAAAVGLFFVGHGLRPVADEIRTFTLSWRWSGVELGTLPGLGVAGLALFLWWAEWRSTALVLAVFVALPLAVLGAAIGGFRRRRLVEKVGWRPTLAVAQTLRSALRMLRLTLGGVGLLGVVWLLGVSSPRLSEAWSVFLEALLVSLPLVTLVTLVYGGYEVLRHAVLRLVLAVDGRLPLACVAFLDRAARLALLRKVGRGYTFYHRVVRDRLATPEAGGAAAAGGERSGR